MAVGKNQTDYQKYFAFLKNNYQKGIHNLSTLLSTPTQADEFIHNLGAVSVIFGVPYSNKDVNSDKLFDLLMSSAYGPTALDTWLQDKYNTTLDDLATKNGTSPYKGQVNIGGGSVEERFVTFEELRAIVATDAVAFRAAGSTEYLHYFINTAMQYEAAAKVIAGAYLCLYQLLAHEPSFNTAYARQHDTIITSNAEVLYQAILKFCGLSNDDNDITNDTDINSLDSLFKNQACMNIACNRYTSLMALVSMHIARATYSKEGQPILNNAVRGASKAVIEAVVGQKVPMQHICSSDHLWEAFFNASYGVSLGLNTLFGLTINTDEFPTIDSLVTPQGEDAFRAIVNHPSAIVDILRSDTALTAIASSQTAMRLLIDSQPAMHAIANSENAMRTLSQIDSVMRLLVTSNIAMNEIASSEIAMNLISDSETAMRVITDATISGNIAMSVILQKIVAIHAINTHETSISVVLTSAYVSTYLGNTAARMDLCESKVGMTYIASRNDLTALCILDSAMIQAMRDSTNAMNCLASSAVARTTILNNYDWAIKQFFMVQSPQRPDCIAMVKLIAGYAGLNPENYDTFAELYKLSEDVKAIINHTYSLDLLVNYDDPIANFIGAQSVYYDVNGNGQTEDCMSVLANISAGMTALNASYVGMTWVAKLNQAVNDIINQATALGVHTALNAMVQSPNAMERLFDNRISTNFSGDQSATMFMCYSNTALDAIVGSTNAVTQLIAKPDAETETVNTNTAITAQKYCASVDVARPVIIKDESMMLKMFNNATWLAKMIEYEWFSKAADFSSAVWTNLIANGTTAAWTQLANNCPVAQWNAIAASATAMNVIVANATVMNIIAASATAMDAIAASATAMDAINSSTTAINAILTSQVAMYYLGKHNSVTTARSNFATTHANIIGRNDSLISAYFAGWLGATAYNTYTSVAGLIGNNTYLTALGGNVTLMALIDAHAVWRSAIVTDIAKVIANNTFWVACCGKANIMASVATNQNALDKIWAQISATNAVCAGEGFSSLVSAQSTINSFGYAASNAGSDYSVWNGKKTFIANSKTIVCSYSGAIKNLTLCPGTYKLEVYGAQGGTGYYSSSAAMPVAGAKGGYAYGNIEPTTATTYYIVVGGQGGKSTAGYNGGGAGANSAGYEGGGGGGCTHIANTNNLLSAKGNTTGLYIVAGGGGGGPGYSNSYYVNATAGGGSSGGAKTSGSNGSYTIYSGSPGTQTAGGTYGTGGSSYSWGGAGSFGKGGGTAGSASGSGTLYGWGGGGGGLYGGGTGCYETGGSNFASGGGGGSGYIGGVTGGSMTNGSRSGNGYAVITRVSA